MDRLYKQAIIASGTLLIFYLFGLIPTNSLINLLLGYKTFSFSTFWQQITVGVAALAVGGTILVGSIINRDSTTAVYSIVVPGLSLLLFEFIQLATLITQVTGMAWTGLLFSPFILGLGMTLLDYWGGRA